MHLTEHKDYISLIEESEVHSVTCGINKASILQQLDTFDVTKCLPFDIMHTVYEGVAVYHLNLLLHYLIDTRKWLSLTELNHAIQAHHYVYTVTLSVTRSQIKLTGDRQPRENHLARSVQETCKFSKIL